MLNPKLFAEAFPINKVEVFFDAKDHSNFLGFQWEMISQGKMPIGLNVNDLDFNSIGKIGGEKTHTLTVNEIPEHRHEQYGTTANGGSSYQSPIIANAYSAHATGAYTANVGGGQAHNNMPPYIVMAFWRRVA